MLETAESDALLLTAQVRYRTELRRKFQVTNLGWLRWLLPEIQRGGGHICHGPALGTVQLYVFMSADNGLCNNRGGD